MPNALVFILYLLFVQKYIYYDVRVRARVIRAYTVYIVILTRIGNQYRTTRGTNALRTIAAYCFREIRSKRVNITYVYVIEVLAKIDIQNIYPFSRAHPTII